MPIYLSSAPRLTAAFSLLPWARGVDLAGGAHTSAGRIREDEMAREAIQSLPTSTRTLIHWLRFGQNLLDGEREMIAELFRRGFTVICHRDGTGTHGYDVVRI